MKNRGITLLIFTLLATTSINVNAVEMAGPMSCGVWIEKQKNKINYNIGQAWLLGYLSGIAIISEKDILKGTDNLSLFLWIDNYCQKFPLRHTSNAGDALAIELAKQKGLGAIK